jgi:hypothetical protein
MTHLQQILRLYNQPQNTHDGFSEAQMVELEQKLGMRLPAVLRKYYCTLGKQPAINYSHNRLLQPGNEIEFSADRYLIFYEENQGVVYWGIKEEDLQLDNPPVWGNYGSQGMPDWHQETDSTDAFFLLMAVYNGTLGGLRYNAHFLGFVEPELIKLLEDNWAKVPGISWDKQKIYSNDFEDVICLSFDEQKHCTGVFIGTSDEGRFDNMFAYIPVQWLYMYSDDEDFEDD